MKKVSILVLVSFIFNCGGAFSAPRNSRVRTSGGRRAFVRSAGNENAGGVAVQAPQTQTPTVETVYAPATFDADVPSGLPKEVGRKVAIVHDKISEVKSECSGIKKDLDTIFGFTTATTVASGIGTVAAGGAMVSGVMKSKKDKLIEEKENELKLLQSRTDNLSDDPEELKKQIAEIMPSLDEDYARLQKEIEEETKKSKMLGNVRTGLMAGATVTSAVSTGTSIGATVNADKLAKKMSDCNQKLYELKIAKSELEALESSDKLAVEIGENATKILGACTGYNKNNINTVKNKMTASAIISGIGTATGATGTITSAMANSKKVREDDSVKGKKKEKNLNLTANIMAGITTGTSLSTTVISATAIADAKKDSKMAEECEAVLK